MAVMGQRFGQRLREARETVGLSQSKLALLSEAHQQDISSAELGKTPASDGVLKKIAPHLGLTFSALKAWALEDELGEEEARRVARALLKEEAPPLPERSLSGDTGEAQASG